MATQYRLPWIPADEPVAHVPFGYQLQRKTLCKQRVLSVLPVYNFAGKVMGLLPLDRRRWLAADVIHHAGNAIDFIDYSVRHAA